METNKMLALIEKAFALDSFEYFIHIIFKQKRNQKEGYIVISDTIGLRALT